MNPVTANRFVGIRAFLFSNELAQIDFLPDESHQGKIFHWQMTSLACSRALAH